MRELYIVCRDRVIGFDPVTLTSPTPGIFTTMKHTAFLGPGTRGDPPGSARWWTRIYMAHKFRSITDATATALQASGYVVRYRGDQRTWREMEVVR